MFFVIQFAFSDCRHFLEKETGLILRPHWPAPAEKDFIRSHGEIKYRKGGGSKDLKDLAESNFCDAHRCIRFTSFPSVFIEKSHSNLILTPIFRRFLLNSAVGRYEIGFAHDKRIINEAEDTPNPKLFEDLIESILETEVKVFLSNKSSETPKIKKIGTCPTLLAQNYLYASTSFKKVSDRDIAKWWVESCTSILFIRTSYRDPLQTIPQETLNQDLSEKYGIQLFHRWYRYQGNNFIIWHLHTLKSYNKQAERDLRLYLLRLHAERKVLEYISQKIATGDISPSVKSLASDKLQIYFKKAIKRITGFPKSLKKANQAEILRFAYESEEKLFAHQRYSLLEKLKDQIKIRPQIFGNIQNYFADYDIKYSQPDLLEDEDQPDLLKLEEKTRLIGIVANLPYFTDYGIRGRRIFIGEMADLRRFSEIALSGEPNLVAADLVGRLERFGQLPEKPTYHSLGALLNAMLSLPELSHENTVFIASLIVRYSLIADPLYLDKLREKYDIVVV